MTHIWVVRRQTVNNRRTVQQYFSSKTLGRLQRGLGSFGEETTFLDLLGIETRSHVHPTSSMANMPIEYVNYFRHYIT